MRRGLLPAGPEVCPRTGEETADLAAHQPGRHAALLGGRTRAAAEQDRVLEHEQHPRGESRACWPRQQVLEQVGREPLAVAVHLRLELLGIDSVLVPGERGWLVAQRIAGCEHAHERVKVLTAGR